MGHITDPGLAAALAGGGEGDDAGIFLLTENSLQKGAFTGAVGANQCHHLAAMQMQTDIAQDLLPANLHRQILYPKAAGIAASSAVNSWFHPNASFTVLML